MQNSLQNAPEKRINVSLDLYPKAALLIHFKDIGPCSSCVFFFISAVRQLIPRYWKSSKFQIPKWIETLNGIMRMEELLSENNDTTEKFKGVWLTWITFKDSPLC